MNTIKRNQDSGMAQSPKSSLILCKTAISNSRIFCYIFSIVQGAKVQNYKKKYLLTENCDFGKKLSGLWNKGINR